MSKRYTLAALAGIAALFAAPAVADGYANKTVNHGPPPLKAHAITPPEPGCYPVGPDTWSCPPVQQEVVHHAAAKHTYGATTRTYLDESKTRHYTNHYTTGGECCGGTPPPPRPRPRPPVTKVHIDRGMVIDIAGFGGGVGAGVDGGYYGGGGGFAYASASSSASAFSSAAASLTFRGGFKGRGGKKGGGGCGCR